MRCLNFAKRNFKELIRDPLSIVFTILLPLFLLFIFQQFKIPDDSYRLENFTPGIILFGFSFITLFTATLVSKDRTSQLLIRLGISPMKSADYIIGYIISLMPIILIQETLFFTLACLLGLKFSVAILLAGLTSIFASIFFIATGILIGTLLSEKAASGISSVIVQLVCFTSGMYFPKELVGLAFSKICDHLPFAPLLTIIKAIMNNDLKAISLRDIIVFLVYMFTIFIISIIVFNKKMTSDNK